MYALNPLQSWILVIGLIVLAVLLVTTVLGSPFDPIDGTDNEEDDSVLDEREPMIDDDDIDWQAVPAYCGSDLDEIYDWAQRGL